jgi:hypothetical protein
MMDHNEFGRQGNRHRSLDGAKKTKQLAAIKKYDYTQSQYVSETEEELYSDEDDKRNKNKKKIKVFSLGYFSQLMNKKIYSDDFDMSSDQIIRKKQKQQNAGSLMECPISEDVESEDNDHDYLSDYSSSSTFSFKKKKMSFDLSRFIDKLEPISFDDSGSSLGFGGRHFYSGAVNETI